MQYDGKTMMSCSILAIPYPWTVWEKSVGRQNLFFSRLIATKNLFPLFGRAEADYTIPTKKEHPKKERKSDDNGYNIS